VGVGGCEEGGREGGGGECRRAGATSNKKVSLSAIFFGIRQCAATFFFSVPKLQTDLDLNLLYILIFREYGTFTVNNKMPALGVCVPKTCSSAGRMSAASASRLRYNRQIISFPQQRIR